jgi:hypothetical protein
MHPLDNECKRSKRIQEKNEVIFTSILQKISDYIQTFQMETDTIEKIRIIVNIYILIVDNFDIIINSKSNRNCIFNLFKLMITKKNGFESDILNNEHERNNKTIQKLYKTFIKTYTKFENRYIDFYFRNYCVSTTINENRDCPICLEIIQKKKQIITNCGHCFHKFCLFMHIIEKETCPLCRTSI